MTFTKALGDFVAFVKSQVVIKGEGRTPSTAVMTVFSPDFLQADR